MCSHYVLSLKYVNPRNSYNVRLCFMSYRQIYHFFATYFYFYNIMLYGDLRNLRHSYYMFVYCNIDYEILRFLATIEKYVRRS